MSWIPYAIFLSLPLWWALGMDMFIWPLLVLPMAWALVVNRRNIRVPGGFYLWLLFLIWAALSAITLVDVSTVKLVAFAWRFSLYFSVTIVFIYFYNASPENLSRRVISSTTVYWTLFTLAGYAGVVFPLLAYESPMTHFVPSWLSENKFVQDAVIERELARINWFHLPRPNAGFPYTNQWGSAFALILPFVAASYALSSSNLKKTFLVIVLGLAAVPLTFSLNRGAWLSAGIGLIYAIALGLSRKEPRITWAATIPILMLGGMVLLTPLKEVVTTGVKYKGGSNNTRLMLYEESARAAMNAPLFGHGTPGASDSGMNVDVKDTDTQEKSSHPSVGTHGQIWLVLYSQGFVGLSLFLGWLAYLVLKTRRAVSIPGVFSHVVVVIGVMQMAVYELTGTRLAIVFIAATIALRECKSDSGETLINGRSP